MRQGEITARAAQDPFDPIVTPRSHIAEADLVGGWRLDDYDMNSPAEFAQVVAATAIDHASGGVSKSTAFNLDIRTTPISRSSTTHDLSDRVFDSASRAGMQQDILDRLAPWAFEIAQRLRAPLTLDWARLCAGDLVLVTLPARGRTAATRGGYSSHPCIVATVEPDFSAGVCWVELLTIEES